MDLFEHKYSTVEICWNILNIIECIIFDPNLIEIIEVRSKKSKKEETVYKWVCNVFDIND